ncbi:MAG TPA: pyridoxamine 5'-phosphate oxidase family protein [Candidatus Dormibacteraeota bacterium]|nr:pyridoxamine 5'-phosphate oxidase family protein [Candidatus Dormibacteraeota bacterium]
MGERSHIDLEVLSEEECRNLLARRNLGRVALTVDDQPEVFPVNYIADESTIVFRTAEGTKLRQAAKRRVAFEIDDWDPRAGVGWSVMVKGVAQDVTDALDRFGAALHALPVVPLAPGSREHWMAIYPSEVTGRRFRVP